MKVTFTAPNKLAKKQTYTPDKIKEYKKLVRERFLEETQNSRFAISIHALRVEGD